MRNDDLLAIGHPQFATAKLIGKIRHGDHLCGVTRRAAQLFQADAGRDIAVMPMRMRIIAEPAIKASIVTATFAGGQCGLTYPKLSSVVP
mgnify:CR=1 FL=1